MKIEDTMEWLRIRTSQDMHTDDAQSVTAGKQIEYIPNFRMNNLFFLIKAPEMQFIFETGLLYTLQDTALLLRRGQLLALDNQTPGIPVPIA